MTTASINGQSIQLSGELKFPTIVKLRREVENLLDSMSGAVTVDFSEVSRVDSSALSFWLCCLRFSEKKGMQLQALNMPNEMQGIVRLVGLDDKIN